MDAKIDPLHIESNAGKTFICIVFFSFVAVALWCTPLPGEFSKFIYDLKLMKKSGKQFITCEFQKNLSPK